MILADSDVLIDFLRRREPMRSRVRAEILQRNLVTSAVNIFELACGIQNDDDRIRFDALRSVVGTLRLDGASARLAGEIDQELRLTGRRLATGDTLIAGVALAYGIPLLTKNVQDFERVPGLRLSSL